MFVVEVVNKIQKTVVIMGGGFHPFHQGHLALYMSAAKAFPNADLYIAASDDTKERPFPFAVKQKLAQIAGIDPSHFVQVKSPFRPTEITERYNPETTALIFVRSEKDRNENPIPGGKKKDGSPSYFQLLSKHLEPLIQHAYFAYLPTVKFQAGKGGVTSASQIRAMWPTADPGAKQKIVTDLYPRIANNQRTIAQVIKLLDSALVE